MDYICEYLKEHYWSIIIVVFLIVICGLLIWLLSKDDCPEIISSNSVMSTKETNNIEENKEYVIVDIKGAVKKANTYKVEKNSTISDVIKKAGGLLKSATTIDINLSKQVYNEMVIYVSTKSEFNKKNKEEKPEKNEIASKDTFVSDYNNITANKNILSNNTTSEDKNKMENEEESKLININTSNLEQLQKIPGIGESKAEKIILYRNENGLFKSIEDIKNVSGIGNSIYEKIKNYITV